MVSVFWGRKEVGDTNRGRKEGGVGNLEVGSKKIISRNCITFFYRDQ